MTTRMVSVLAVMTVMPDVRVAAVLAAEIPMASVTAASCARKQQRSNRLELLSTQLVQSGVACEVWSLHPYSIHSILQHPTASYSIL